MYIKIKIKDVESGKISTEVTEEMSNIAQKYGLKINKGDDIGHRIVYIDLNGYRYIKLALYDLKGKNRRHPVSEEESKEVVKFAKEAGFEVVSSIPEILDRIIKEDA
jgi:hypothetical protein